MSRFDLTTRLGRLKTILDYLWTDHAFLRVGFQNAHWIGEDLVRTNQPWPFQLKWWRDHGVRTVVNLRGGDYDTSFYALEKQACADLGLELINLPMGSREVPSRERVRAAKHTFETMAYPAVMHCKSGADRTGLMGVLYRHFHLGEPIREALGKELGLRTLHVRHGKTGVLDYLFERYLAEAEPQGISFMDWVESPAYDPARIKADFQAGWWGTLLTEKLLRRE